MLALAREQDALSTWSAELASLRGLFEDPTVAQFLQNTNIAEDRKFATLDEALAGSPAAVLNLAKLLVRKRRVGIGVQVVEAFIDMVNAERGIALASVTTAQPLDDIRRAAVIAAVRQATGADAVELSEQVDREVLGGAIIQIGDHIIDGSVRTRLSGLKRSIAGSIR